MSRIQDDFERAFTRITGRCPKHPAASIRREYDLTQRIVNGTPSGEGIKSNHHYFCAECGFELPDVRLSNSTLNKRNNV